MSALRSIRRLLRADRPVARSVFVGCALVVIVLDQLTKAWAIGALEGHPPIVLIPDFLQLVYRTNTGAAFSLFANHPTILGLLSAAIGVGIALYAWLLPRIEQGLRPALGLILGGAVGNLIDRVRVGSVVDFIDAHWREVYHWPTFNVADSAVCIGIALILIGAFVDWWQNRPARSSEDA